MLTGATLLFISLSLISRVKIYISVFNKIKLFRSQRARALRDILFILHPVLFLFFYLFVWFGLVTKYSYIHYISQCWERQQVKRGRTYLGSWCKEYTQPWHGVSGRAWPQEAWSSDQRLGLPTHISADREEPRNGGPQVSLSCFSFCLAWKPSTDMAPSTCRVSLPSSVKPA